MIGVDTNILVRAVLDNNLLEASIAKKLLKQTATKKKLFVSSYAILELVWVLKVKDKTKQQIIEVILNLVDSPGITIGQREAIMTALEYYQNSKADFGDYLILAEGEEYRTNKLTSFDRALCKDNHHFLHPSKLID